MQKVATLLQKELVQEAVIPLLESVADGAGGGGATKIIGSGGYSGGAAISVEIDTILEGGKDGFSGNHIENKDRYEYYYSGGGYFSGPDGKDGKNKDRAKLCLGGFSSLGQDKETMSSTGGTGGSGGVVIITDYATLTANNGNKITDNLSQQPLEINCQNGMIIEKYSYKKVEGKTFLLKRISKNKKIKTTNFGQGIGSGAGYYEISNGIYRDQSAEDK